MWDSLDEGSGKVELNWGAPDEFAFIGTKTHKFIAPPSDQRSYSRGGAAEDATTLH